MENNSYYSQIGIIDYASFYKNHYNTEFGTHEKIFLTSLGFRPKAEIPDDKGSSNILKEAKDVIDFEVSFANTFYVYESKSKDLMIKIDKFNDEWFIVMFMESFDNYILAPALLHFPSTSSLYIETYYQCDQWDGLLIFLDEKIPKNNNRIYDNRLPFRTIQYQSDKD